MIVTIEGRKRFQKQVCILKHKYEVPFSYEFIPYHYGPFSESLTAAIDNLVSLGYVKEIQSEYSGFLQYTYELTTVGKNFTRKQLLKMKKQNNFIYNVLSTITPKLNAMSIQQLVKLSKDATQHMYV